MPTRKKREKQKAREEQQVKVRNQTEGLVEPYYTEEVTMPEKGSNPGEGVCLLLNNEGMLIVSQI